jgi:DNA-directed RNA polymerase specialized sigma24 family protein
VTFEEYLAARLPALVRYAVMLTGDPYSAEDIVQDAMLGPIGSGAGCSGPTIRTGTSNGS